MLKVLYEDAELLVVIKPAGTESQESKGLAPDMVSEIKKHLKKNGAEDMYVGVVHRLDKPVSGVMVYAKTKKSAAELSRQISSAGHMDKVYLAVVAGRMDTEKTVLSCNMSFDKASNTSYVSEHGQHAELEYEVLGNGDASQAFTGEWAVFEPQRRALAMASREITEASLLKIRLKTGRHHQIRVQMSAEGHPLIGDVRYNPEFKGYRGKNALMLISSEIEFTHPVSGQRMRFTYDNK